MPTPFAPSTLDALASLVERRGRTLGRLTRHATKHPGVSVLVLDPTALAVGNLRAA